MDTMIPVAEMRRKILPKVLIRFFFGFIFPGLLIFVPAGTIKFFNGWLLIAGLFIPMYLSATVLYLASAVVMGSYYALIPMVLVPFLLAFRIKNEEKILLTGLPGYEEYVKKVKYRMIPFVW